MRAARWRPAGVRLAGGDRPGRKGRAEKRKCRGGGHDKPSVFLCRARREVKPLLRSRGARHEFALSAQRRLRVRARPCYCAASPPDGRLPSDTPWIGEVAEWSNAPHSKCGIRATVSGVRIPPSPPATIDFIDKFRFRRHSAYSHAYIAALVQTWTYEKRPRRVVVCHRVFAKSSAWLRFVFRRLGVPAATSDVVANFRLGAVQSERNRSIEL